MLGRTANDLFWMARYIERAENIARLLEVGYRLTLVPQDAGDLEWRATLRAAGCEGAYLARHDALTTSDVVEFLLRDTGNPSSVQSCLTTARRNARAQRTALTRDMWESLNSAWMDFPARAEAAIANNTLPDLFDWIRDRSALFRGAMLNTILRNDTFWFPQLGTFVERADNTARILDVRHHALLPENALAGGGVDSTQLTAILRSVSAHRSFRWVYRDAFKPWHVADFLILNPQMPRSLRSCYVQLDGALAALAALYGAEPPCRAMAADTLARLTGGDMTRILQSGLHDFLAGFITANNRLADSLASAYHFND